MARGQTTKGQSTKDAILNKAFDLSSEIGLEGLSFGILAKRIGMSKSGLYAHFGSKESLQCDVLDTAAARFVDVVITPALKEPRGLPRIEALFANWLTWDTDELTGGCPIMAAATEFDDRPGPVRDAIKGHLRDLLGGLTRSARIAIEEGHFRADLDPNQFAYEVWGVLVAHHHFERLLEDALALERAKIAFENLILQSKS